jgi:hypothetical protein
MIAVSKPQEIDVRLVRIGTKLREISSNIMHQTSTLKKQKVSLNRIKPATLKH